MLEFYLRFFECIILNLLNKTVRDIWTFNAPPQSQFRYNALKFSGILMYITFLDCTVVRFVLVTSAIQGGDSFQGFGV